MKHRRFIGWLLLSPSICYLFYAIIDSFGWEILPGLFIFALFVLVTLAGILLLCGVDIDDFRQRRK